MGTRKITLNELRSIVKNIVKEQENEYATAWQEKNQNNNSNMVSQSDGIRYDLSPKERLVLFKTDMNKLLKQMDGVNNSQHVEWAGEIVNGYQRYLMRLELANDHGYSWGNDK